MIAIIPARGGSKGLPGKNIRPLLGKPLIVYTIDVALQSKYINEVIISTDDPLIAEIAEKAGAINPFMRPPELATDTAMAIDNYIYTIDRLNLNREKLIEDVIIMQPTTPLKLVDDINGAIELYYEKKADSVITYCEEHHPITWHKYINDDYSFKDIFDLNNLKNRQENIKTFYPNGAAFIFQVDKTIRQKVYYTNKSYAYIMPRNRSVDIDTLEDFEYANFLLSRKI